MTTITFDTLAYAERLRDAGVPEQQAKVQASVLAEALSSSRNELATRTDIALVQRDLQELGMRMATKTDLAELKADLLKWVIGLFIAQVGLFAALVKLLH
jgi:hypothetical protein